MRMLLIHHDQCKAVKFMWERIDGVGWEISIAKSGLKVHKNLSISGSGDSLRAQAAFPDRGPGFDSQHPQGRSQPSVNPVPKELTPALLSLGNRHTRGAHTQIFIHLIAKFLF